MAITTERRRLAWLVALAPLAPLTSLGAWPLSARAHGSAHHGAGHGSGHGGHAAAALPPEQKPWGIAGDPRRVRRTIEIRMTDDMRFTPDRLTVREGETVRLRAVNRGRVMHEIVIGTPEELAAHAELMKRHPDMEHDEPYMAHVPPGQRGEIVWHFNRAGDFQFACLIPGHFEAGMVGHIRVEPAAGTDKERTR
ncbi:cupredoxin family protein [Tepidimonas taiwanensis]|uniref:Plastocyanin n=1 Tax=Tepidimonas taiwanensis TaxID=307486 RepID=A0A554WXM7_9BURK|nr:cupredoxin family protein [Tepidimonas taiwanensis]TSE28318.1 Plastocyanin [Tepidimonas taiwanensis]UBQ04765.1 cupredoxin family protein [Tepidimonas taiwanensis]